jgi:hypothetical protein
MPGELYRPVRIPFPKADPEEDRGRCVAIVDQERSALQVPFAMESEFPDRVRKERYFDPDFYQMEVELFQRVSLRQADSRRRVLIEVIEVIEATTELGGLAA